MGLAYSEGWTTWGSPWTCWSCATTSAPSSTLYLVRLMPTLSVPCPSIRKPKDPPGGLQVQVPPQFYEQLHLPDPTTIRLNLIPYFYKVTVSDSMVEYPVIGGVFLINKSKQNQFLKEFCAELLYEGLPTVGDSFTMGTKFYNNHKRLEKMFCSYTMVLHAFAFTVTMLG